MDIGFELKPKQWPKLAEEITTALGSTGTENAKVPIQAQKWWEPWRLLVV